MKKKIFIILFLMLFMITGCKDKKVEKPVENNLDTNEVIKDPNIIYVDEATDIEDYYSKLMLYAGLLYDNGFCDTNTIETQTGKICKITLSDMVNNLNEYNFDNLFEYNGVRCDITKNIVYVDLNDIDNISFSVSADKNCIK